MAYEKQTWVDGVTPLDAAHLNHMEQGISQLSEEIGNLGGGTGTGGSSGLTTAQVNALDGMFKVCAFIKADISAEYNEFCTAFGIEAATITGISATYSGGNVTAGTSVDELTGIVVTANYSDGSKRTVTGYTLSGTIAEGSNTITVTYEGMTTTFTVTGVAEPSTILQATNAAITTAGATDVWTAGYINDSGEVAAMDANYFYDEYLEAQGFVFLNSSNAAIGSQLRIAEYDSGKAFISRKLVTNTTYAIGDNSPSFIKCGFAPGINRSDIHTITPLIRMADLCTVKNVTIDTTGAAVEYDGRNATDYISLADSIGSFYVKAIGVSAIVALYDSNYALVDRIAFGSGGEQLIAIPDGAKYIRICVAGDAVYTSLKFTAA